MSEKVELNTLISNNQTQTQSLLPVSSCNKPIMPNSIFGTSVNDYSNDIMCQNLNFAGTQSANTPQPEPVQQQEPKTEDKPTPAVTETPQEEVPGKTNGKAKYVGAGTGFILPVVPKLIDLAKGGKFKEIFKLKALALPCLVLSAAGYVIGKLTGDCLANRHKVTESTP